jgi:hypothetical protein
MDLLNWLWNWLTSQLSYLVASIHGPLLQSLSSLLASWSTGHTPHASPAPTDLAATPELSSILLFGSGLIGASGYALARFRARQRSYPNQVGLTGRSAERRVSPHCVGEVR